MALKSNITAVPVDYKPPTGSGTFTKTAPGVYHSKRIEFWKTKDTKIRFLKKQRNGWSARFNFMLTEGGKQAHFPLYTEVPLIAFAFLRKANKTDVKLPEQPDYNNAAAVGVYLEEIETIVNGLGVELKVTVKDDGFISFIEGMVIPDDIYLWRVVRVLSEDDMGQPSWRKQDFGEDSEGNKRYGYFVDYLGEIIKPIEDTGVPSPYCGAKFRFSVPYKFIYYPEEERVDWEKTDGGAITTAASRHGKLWSILAPEMFQIPETIAMWINPANYVPLWVTEVDPRIVLRSAISYVVSESGFSQYVPDLDNVVDRKLPEDIAPVMVVGKTGSVPTSVVSADSVASPDTVVATPEETPAATQETTVDAALEGTQWDVPARQIFGNVLTAWAGKPVLDESFNPIDKPWLKANLGPLKKAGLIGKGTISTFNYMVVSEIIAVFIEQDVLGDSLEKVKELQQELIKLPISGSEELASPEDEEDGDF